MPTSRLHISLDAITKNYKSLDALSDGMCHTGAAVKANAYGLGMKMIAPALHRAGCRYFFVARLEEGVQLREQFRTEGLEADIIVFDGPRANEMNEYTAFGITPTLNHRAQPALLRSEAVRTQVSQRAFLHVDTAMNRLGMSASEAGEFLRAPEDDIQISYIMSHLACADEPDNSLNINQQLRLRKVCNYAPHIPISLANSGGIFLGPDYQYQLARPGISLYGSAPDDSASSILRPVLRWEADILQIAEIHAGSTIGYGASYRAETDMTIATIGAGYADGYPRALSNTSSVEICGITLPVIGRVSMDLITVDISSLSPTQITLATHAILIGTHYSPSQMAADTGTISYEILTGLGARLSRHYDSMS